MNRLILIGNGFDLAHGMKTSYNDFILWYLKKCFCEAFEKGSNGDNELIQIYTRNKISVGGVKDIVEYFVDYYYEKKFDGFEAGNAQIPGFDNIYGSPFSVKLNSDLFRRLLGNCSHLKWVEIENEFYSSLKSLLNAINLDYQKEQLQLLNKSLFLIIKELNEYLSTIQAQTFNQAYRDIFNSSIFKEDIVIKNDLVKDEEAKKTLILNFNYTSTPENYLPQEQDKILKYNINYIHGKIYDHNNPLIFGFGDELDSDYSKLELQKSNVFFEYIKSFWYFKTSNYHNLVRFIDGDEFQVYILGHSCGLSDRTMLNMIFEHDNCKSIKIFYHGTKEKNNYTNLTQEISRHFKDKGMMRKKIVPFDKSEPMPQVE